MEVPNTVEPAPERKQHPWMLLVYFIGIFIFAKVIGMIFMAMEGSPSLAGFAKLNQMIHESLDVTRHRDDSIVTVFSLFLTTLLVIPICWCYAYTRIKAGVDPSICQPLILMAVIVCGTMMLIQEQFSRALALVGVVSAVRFRTNLRDPKDAVYLLVSIGIGMGAGLQVYRVALWMTIVMCIVFLVLSKYQIGESPAGEANFLDSKPNKDKKDKKGKKDKKDKKDKKKKNKDAGESEVEEVPATRLGGIADSIVDT